MSLPIAPAAFLAADEPAPFVVLNADAQAGLLLVCDHASARLPRCLGTLGVAPPVLASHLAVDLGAAELTRHLARHFGATAVLAGYSRLAVDLNRDLARPDAFLAFGDGVAIPGNSELSAAAKAARAAALYQPYHAAVSAQVARLRAATERPLVLGVHSFSPVVDGQHRPWQFGVLWDADAVTAAALMRGLRAAGFAVGDNQPYSARLPYNHTLDTHARAAGLPHAIIEVRQDLLADAAGIARVAAVLEPVVGAALRRLAEDHTTGPHARAGGDERHAAT